MALKCALIGCGRISFKHTEAYASCRERANLIAVCDVVEERAKIRAAEYEKNTGRKVKAYTDFRELISAERPDMVSIATESGNHAEITLACLEAGIHVLVEKPMALNTADAEKMIATAKRKGLRLGVCFQNRFNAPVQKARKALETERFGRLTHVTAQIRWNRNADYYAEAPWRGTWAQDGGALMNQCTHAIDLLQWFLGGRIRKVHGVTRRFLRPIEAEDFGAALVESENGAVGILEGTVDIFPKNLNETFSVFGEKGSVVIGGLAMNKLETWRFADAAQVGDSEETVLDPTVKDPPTVYGFGHNALFADFMAAVETGKDPLVSGEGGKVALDIILAIYQAMKTGESVTFPVNFSTMEMVGTFGRTS